MVTIRIIPALARVAVVLAVLAPTVGSAHTELEAVLDTEQETPPPVGTNPGAGGTGDFVLEDDGTVQAMVEYQGLTGSPAAAHIHQGAPGVPGGIVSGYGASLGGLGPDGTITGTGDTPLTAAQQQALFAGLMYFNIHTTQNISGEIRGQIQLKPGTCSCDEATSPGTFKRCVKKAIKALPKDERQEASVKTLKRLAAKSKCGKTKAPKKAVACCLPFTPAQNIVTEQMCASVKEAKCTKLGGTSMGTGVACSPSPCEAASPSGAFVEGPAG